jgi:acetate kinase
VSRVLVLNSGSSSVKYAAFTGPADDLREVGHGLVERIGEPGGPASHEQALAAADGEVGLDAGDLVAIGHRVVHGGRSFQRPTLITDEVVEEIRRLTPLAPLHNPPNLAGIQVARRRRPDLPQVAVFDTAFHASMPAAAATYAIDVEVARRYAIRRYGFHGTSHGYVARETARLLDRPLDTVNVITLHLGNGASAAAVRGGVSVDTSMGLTPLEGLVMGTRSGDLDPAVVFHLDRVAGMSLDEIDRLLNKRSGLRGLAGANDVREVLRRRAAGDQAARLAIEVYCHRIRRYVGAFLAVLGHTHAVTFTAGVGEHSADIRAQALDGLAGLGIEVDPDRNAAPADGPRIVSPDGAPIAVCVVPTDEEREIAHQTLALLTAESRKTVNNP